MYHIMFDIDGTLVKSEPFDEQCYLDAVLEVTGKPLCKDWHLYPHITGSGIFASHLATHSMSDRFADMVQQVTTHFTEGVRNYLKQHSVEPISGAAALIESLKKSDRVSLSLATGGWREAAMLKLQYAGIDIDGIAFASSNDHHIRTEIMRIALDRACVTPDQRITYVGDGEWDRQACSELGWNFVLVGNRTQHYQSVTDLSDPERVIAFLD